MCRRNWRYRAWWDTSFETNCEQEFVEAGDAAAIEAVEL
jgi:hypothetical protein